MLQQLSNALWFPFLLTLFLLVGLIYSVGSGFFPIFGWKTWLGTILGSLRKASHRKDGLSPFQALSTALASTIGTGSIAGVASALTLGGPGALFWMWVTALLGMMTSCAEKLLSVRYQCRDSSGSLQGGPMFYLRDRLHAPLLARWFALFCLPASFVGGNLIQASSIADAMQSTFGTGRLQTGLLFAILCASILSGGLKRIAGVSSLLVPLMAGLYLGGGLLVILHNRANLPEALRAVFTCALCPGAAFGGVSGWSVTAAIRHGVARGVFTSEAGLGTSAMAHGAAAPDHPAEQGMWGILEVFCSTLLVCTVTALVILTAEPNLTLPGGAHTTAAAFSSALGRPGELIVSFSLLLFAFSSILGWSYYARQALHFLTGSDALLPLCHILFLLCIPVGSVTDSTSLWAAVDLWDGLMALPNLIALLLLAPEVLQTLRRWLDRQ